MPWGRCDDQFYRHEKVGELDPDLELACIGLYWKAISWCNDRLTDGRVPAGTVRTLGGTPELADELVRVGLWDRDGIGFVVHDYLAYNKSREQIERERAQRALAGAAGAAARWHSDSDLPSDVPNDLLSEMNGGSNGPVSRIPVTSNHNPNTHKETLIARAREGLPNLDDKAIEALETLTKRPWPQAGQKQLGEYDRLIGDHGVDRTVEALTRVAANLPQSPPPTARQLIWPALRILEPFPDAKVIQIAEREAERERVRANRKPDPLREQIKAAMEARDAAGGDS